MNKLFVLVVEDDQSVRNLIVTTLRTHGYRYAEAPTGEAAIVQASSHNPDVILLDLGLPDMDGISILKFVREWSTCPIIVVSDELAQSGSDGGQLECEGRKNSLTVR